jgi:hypothetical protein
MDWAKAIEINHTALMRIVAALIAVMRTVGGGMAERLTPRVYRAVVRVLRPAESAVRRLIIVAARGLVVKLPPSRPMPAGLKASGKKGGASNLFQLFDSRKRFNRRVRRRRIGPRIEPRVHSIDFSPFAAPFKPTSELIAARESDGTVSAARLGRRLAAIKAALEDLPRQAKRLARWRARRRAIAESANMKSTRC